MTMPTRDKLKGEALLALNEAKRLLDSATTTSPGTVAFVKVAIANGFIQLANAYTELTK